MHNIDTIPARQVARSIRRLQRRKRFPGCLVWLPFLPAPELSRPGLCLYRAREHMLHNYWNTCAKSLFAKLRWEFSVFNRPQNFSSLPWGELLWFNSCTWGLHLNHLRSEVQYLLKAATIRHSLCIPLQAHLDFFPPFFLFNFKVRNILPRGKKALETR